MAWLTKLFGDPNEKALRTIRPIVDHINSLEPEVQELSDAALRARTDTFRQRYMDGEDLDDLLPEAFATVREAACRVLGMRHYDMQMIGGIVLHQGKIAEMKTGEGKTLAATLAAYLNALTGEGVHVITVNDYLASRDSEWMGKIYRFLGLTVAAITNDMDTDYLRRTANRKAAYAADITYGTNNEFGFDYLRDNLATTLEYVTQRGLAYAIVDEVDNILIDEARTPLIISGPAEEPAELYYQFARLAAQLHADQDYIVDEKTRTVSLTDEGMARMEKMAGIGNIYDERNIRVTHYMEQAVKAHALFKRDRDYVVRDGQVLIVDEFTGRLMVGRRYSEGLHQAIEAKESVKIERENITQATITFQNYFRMYGKLAGMTGTALTEAEELYKIYHLDVMAIPTSRPMVRQDYSDLVFKTEAAKFNAVVEEIADAYSREQPVLVGTISIEKSEELSHKLIENGVPHNVLNAKQHEREAHIIAQAGRSAAVTIATNMAGRGTDIVLGGNPDALFEEICTEQALDPADLATDPDALTQARQAAQERWKADHEKVLGLGGLYIIGTERHESRRIDNQLRGRSGRQGDPGMSRFFVSLDDDLMRRVGTDRVRPMLDRLGLEDDQAIENSLVTRAIESAQTRVEGWNFDMRKHVVEYDDVINQQRTVIYKDRRRILEGDDVHDIIAQMMADELHAVCDEFLFDPYQDNWNIDGLLTTVRTIFPLPDEYTHDHIANMTREEVENALLTEEAAAYQQREEQLGAETMRQIERLLLLQVIDTLWVKHIDAIDELREGITLRAVGQKDPLVEFKSDAFHMYGNLQHEIRHTIALYVHHLEVQVMQQQAPPPQIATAEPPHIPYDTQREQQMMMMAAARQGGGATTLPPTAPLSSAAPPARKPGRNEPCWCGSGKKYKHCHGR